MRSKLPWLCIGLAACVSITPGGEKVRTTTNPDVVRGCKYLGPVKTHGSGWRGGLAAENTEKTIRNKTAEMGGNVVFIITSGQQSTGDAYLCPPQTAPSP